MLILYELKYRSFSSPVRFVFILLIRSHRPISSSISEHEAFSVKNCFVPALCLALLVVLYIFLI